jgi:tryptophan synthase alpha chain
VADGPVIQRCAERAIANGMTVELLFQQLERLRERVSIPVLLMGYLNPVYQFGIERFFESARAVGIDGVILPDLPVEEYQKRYQDKFQGLEFIGLITPTTSDERARWIDSVTGGFLYVVSAPGVTGKTAQLSTDYLKRIQSLGLRNPLVVGFGIRDRASFEAATEYAKGAIVGTAFMQALEAGGEVKQFIQQIRGTAQ